MTGIFPNELAGGLIVRDPDTGLPTNPPEVENAYVPDPAFAITCDERALPSDCSARIEPRQINALMSELLSFAECLDPDGTWDCTSLQNLCNAFTDWKNENLPAFDEVQWIDEYADLPSPGQEDVVYIVKEDNRAYRWDGIGYVEISPAIGGLLILDNYAALRNSSPMDNQLAFIRGFNTPGDGGHGLFNWDPDSSDEVYLGYRTDLIGGGGGRYNRMHEGTITAESFGLVGDDFTDNSAMFTDAARASKEFGFILYFGPKVYRGFFEVPPPVQAEYSGGIKIQGAGDGLTYLKPPFIGEGDILTIRGIPYQVYVQITGLVNSSGETPPVTPAVMTFASVDAFFEGFIGRIYGMVGSEGGNTQVVILKNINTVAKTAELWNNADQPINTSAWGEYYAGGSMLKLVQTCNARGGFIRDLSIHGNGRLDPNGISGVNIMATFGLNIQNVSIEYCSFFGIYTYGDLLWHAIFPVNIAQVYAENPIRFTTLTAMDATFYADGSNIILMGLAGTVGNLLNGTVQVIDRIDSTHFTIPGVDGTTLTWGGGGAISYTNMDYSGNSYPRFDSVTIRFNESIGYNDFFYGASTSAVFDRCHIASNGGDGMRANSPAMRFLGGQIAYNGINYNGTAWNPGEIVGLRIGNLNSSIINFTIENCQMDSNKSAHIILQAAMQFHLNQVQMLTGVLSDGSGDPALRGPPTFVQMGAGGSTQVRSIHVNGLTCRFDDGATVTVGVMTASACRDVHFRDVDVTNNTGGVTIELTNAGWTSGGANYLHDYSFRLYDGTMEVEGRTERQWARFRAIKNAQQTGVVPATITPVTFQTEVFDDGAFYASDAWTPGKGRVRISAQVTLESDNLVDHGLFEVWIYKNGATFTQSFYNTVAGQSVSGYVEGVDTADGDDVYTIQIRVSGAGNKIIKFAGNSTWFAGEPAT